MKKRFLKALAREFPPREGERGGGEDDDDKGEEEVEEAHCICRCNYTGHFMIGCDDCGSWFHPPCLGLGHRQKAGGAGGGKPSLTLVSPSGVELDASESWLCPRCGGKESLSFYSHSEGKGTAKAKGKPKPKPKPKGKGREQPKLETTTTAATKKKKKKGEKETKKTGRGIKRGRSEGEESAGDRTRAKRRR